MQLRKGDRARVCRGRWTPQRGPDPSEAEGVLQKCHSKHALRKLRAERTTGCRGQVCSRAWRHLGPPQQTGLDTVAKVIGEGKVRPLEEMHTAGGISRSRRHSLKRKSMPSHLSPNLGMTHKRKKI